MWLKWLKDRLPNRQKIENNFYLQRLKKRLNNPNLWHINCHSLSAGLAAGLFTIFIPLPIQTILAILLCILFRGNLLVAILATWVNNPITFAPLIYLTYKVGELIIGEASQSVPQPEAFKFYSVWWPHTGWFSHFGKAYLLGLPVIAFTTALAAFLLVNLLCLFIKFLKSIISKCK